MSEFTANLEMFTTIAVVGLAAILAVVSGMSYRRLRHPRVFFIGLGFLTFAFKGVYLLKRSLDSRGTEDWLLPLAGVDLLILLFLYLALRVR